MTSRFTNKRNVFRTKAVGPKDPKSVNPRRVITITDDELLPDYLKDVELQRRPYQILFRRDSRLPVSVGPGFASI